MYSLHIGRIGKADGNNSSYLLIVVQTGTYPRKAHDGYWDCMEVADFFAGRLKLDFQVICSNRFCP